MLRFLVTALAMLLLGQTNALMITAPAPAPALAMGSVAARVSCPAVMMAKKSATKSKSIPILLEADVEGIGLKGQIVELKPAYGENTIISKGLGVKATKEQVAQAEADELARVASAAAAKKGAEEAKLSIGNKYGSKGLVIERMFTLDGTMMSGAVTAEEVAQQLSRVAGVTIAPASVSMESIEEVGESAIATVDLHPEVSASVKVVLQKSKITMS